MSEAASAFIPRRGFVKHERRSLDSVTLFASADVAAQTVSRALIPIQRISEQKQSLGTLAFASAGQCRGLTMGLASRSTSSYVLKSPFGRQNICGIQGVHEAGRLLVVLATNPGFSGHLLYSQELSI
jgi:hypothetical protein